MSSDSKIQEESEQWRNPGRARAASIADTEVRVLLSSLNNMSSAQSSDSEHSDLEFEIENLLKARNRASTGAHTASNTKRIKRRSQMTARDQHTSADELPTDHQNKEFWDQIQKTLTKEAETKLLDDPNTPKNRKRTKSWLEAKDKIAQKLEAQSAPESTATSASSSFSQYPTDTTNNNELAPSMQDSSSWWSDLKGDLDKETGAPPEPPKPEDDLSEFADESTLNEPTDNSWWSDLKLTLDQETPADTPPTNSAKTPSENSTPSVEQTRTNKNRQSQSDSGYESGSSAPPTPSGNSVPSTPVFPNSNRDFQDGHKSHGRVHRDSSTYGSLRFSGMPEAMEGSMAAKKGILRFDNGVYRGDIIVSADGYSLAHGYGSFTTSADGEMYIGQWRMGKRDGKGIKVWADGREYVGQWSNNRRSGHGIITWPNGDTYIGEIQFGFQQGHGVMKSNGEKYVGEWNVNERHGFGVMHFKNGDTYSGEWAHNKKHGHGTYKFFDSQVVEGEWENNKFMGSKKQTPIPEVEIVISTPDRRPSTADTEVVSLQTAEATPADATVAPETKQLDSSSDTAHVESSQENNTTTAPVAALEPSKVEAATSTVAAPVANTSTQTETKDRNGTRKKKSHTKHKTVKEKFKIKEKEEIDKSSRRTQSMTGIAQQKKAAEEQPSTPGSKLRKSPSTKSVGSVNKDLPTKEVKDTPSNDNATSGSDKDAPSKPKKEEKKRRLFSFSISGHKDK
mmetsp:Transcript_6559/g.9105  ORF Transcript_6559/g.9105 Transcript_6559/m.9105 type:complete len:735 (-) Transcript_6559:592-2796(-)|eukprot:CAMPEP_0168542724 /NCGR_PEP_ID=MMETSP0413-20121227/1497_1 /TAXON_ID=136452 /ORGANISM="Filamoeba nolandi, Strain NC-AS-23-1" /LENGTH=734 /DNA_ID=CAMNT_0008572613 /DNA_START=122 /DNA_END=2326 /DNA_ORIENTATION=+